MKNVFRERTGSWQREKVVCNVVSTKASVNLLGRFEDGLALLICVLFL